jgi:hypothetical protein
MWPHTWFLQPPYPEGDRTLVAQVLSTTTSRSTAKAGNVLTQAQFPVCYVPVFQPNCGPCAQVWLDGAPLSSLFGLFGGCED